MSGAFPNVNRGVEGYEGLLLAQECVNTNAKRGTFAKDYSYLSQLWEALSPDPILNTYEKDYRWLTKVYESVKPTSGDTGRLLWHTLGAQTMRLIHDHIHVEKISDDLEKNHPGRGCGRGFNEDQRCEKDQAD